MVLCSLFSLVARFGWLDGRDVLVMCWFGVVAPIHKVTACLLCRSGGACSPGLR